MIPQPNSDELRTIALAAGGIIMPPAFIDYIVETVGD